MARIRISSVRASLLLLVLLAGLPGLGLTLHTGVDQRKAAALIAQTETLQLVRSVVAEEQRTIHQMQDLLVGLATRREIRQAGPACSKILAELHRGLTHYINIGVADLDGAVSCSATPVRTPKTIADVVYFQQTLSTGAFALGDYQRDRITGSPSVSAGYPLTDADGTVRGVVFAALNLNSLVQESWGGRLPGGSALTVIDAGGTILLRYPVAQGWEGRPAPEGSIARAVVGGRGAGTAEMIGPDGLRRLYAFAPLSRSSGGTSHSYVSVSIPTAVAYARVNRLLIGNLLGVALVALLGLAAAWWGGDLILVRRLRALVHTAQRLGAGDLSARTGLAYRGAELGQLAQTFDEMAGALQARDVEIRTLNTALEQRVAARTIELREAKAFLEHMIATSPGILFQVDSQRLAVTYVSPNVHRLLGYRPEEIIHRAGALPELMHPEDWADLLNGERKQVREQGVPQLVGREVELAREMRWRHKDGSYRWFAVALRIAHDERGRSTLTLGHGLDVTQRKSAEEAMLQARAEAERANQAKSEFLSRMSHELRTPLNAILGFAQLLQMGALDREQEESVDHILRGGHHLLGLINELLDLTRLESGRLLAMSPEPVTVGKVVQECLDLMAPMALEKQIHIQAGEASTSPQAVLADRQRFKQVVLNLLSNAVKYNHSGGSVVITVADAAPGRVRISVTDTGPGIPEDQQGLLFRPFERLGDQMKVEGTGLGLALTKRLVEAMGGAVGVESTVGVGSTFWVDLAAAERSAVLGPLTAPAEGRGAGPTRTVLYIEDNLANVRLIERILAYRPNIRLLTAMQGRLGLELIREHRPDVVLLDIDLSDLRGDEVLRILRQDAQTSRIPVVVMSATSDPRAHTRMLAAGALACLAKPLVAQKLLRLLDETLSSGKTAAGDEEIQSPAMDTALPRTLVHDGDRGA